MLLDIGVGIIVSILASWYLAFPLTIKFISGSVIFSLLMDIDFVFHVLMGGTSKNAHRHRDYLHFPIFYISVGSIIVYIIGGAPWAFIFALSSLMHFIHDSIGIGWGVQWLWPFISDHYTFFYRYQAPDKEPMPKKYIYVWKDNEIDELAAKYGDENWIRNIYLHWHPYAIIETLIFILALFALYFYLA